MSRILLETDTPGWYREWTEDGPSEKRVRKQDDDHVAEGVVQAQELLDERQLAETKLAAEGNGGSEGGAQRARDAIRAGQMKPDEQVTVAETGKILKGKTVQVACQWEGCTRTRIVKPQDVFQVRYCVQHQKEHRKALTRAKQRAKTAARREKEALLQND